jgi:hypothetical protein
LEGSFFRSPRRFEELEDRNDLIVGENVTERRHPALLQVVAIAGKGD